MRTTEKLAVVKYNAGNICSVLHALRRLGVEATYSDDPEVLGSAEKVIFPGVGEARSAMTYLAARGLDKVVANLTQPVLGICLGQQLLCSFSEERDTECLGVFGERVRRFPPLGKVPHVGWNLLTHTSGPLFKSLPAEPYVYFVHSYYVEPDPAHTAQCAQCDYLVPFSAALERNNFYAVQFHPEKSGEVGAQILKNFLEL